MRLEYLRDIGTAGRLYSANQFLPIATDEFKRNGTDYRGSLKPNGTNERYFFFYTIYDSDAISQKLKPQSMIYGSKALYDSGYYLFECSMNSVQVEVNIVRETDICHVEKLRLDLRRLPYASNAPYDVVNDVETKRNSIGSLREIGGVMSWGRPNPVDS